MSEVSLSTYPTTIDTFDRYSDLDAETMAKAEIYKGYIDAGQYETAATYLTDNPSLEACGITAEIVNKHSDAIVAVETHLNDTRTYLNQTAGVVSSLTESVGTLQTNMTTSQSDIDTLQSDMNTAKWDIAGLEYKTEIINEEKIVGKIGGYTQCKFAKAWNSTELGTATSATLYIPDVKPGYDGSNYTRYIFSVTGVLIDNGEQKLLEKDISDFYYDIVETQGVNIYYSNASEFANKKIIILIDYLRESA